VIGSLVILMAMGGLTEMFQAGYAQKEDRSCLLLLGSQTGASRPYGEIE
jgi:hypothetical protein